MGFLKRNKLPNLQPMLIRKDELKGSIVEAYKEIKHWETEEQKEALKNDDLTISLRSIMNAFLGVVILLGGRSCSILRNRHN